MRRHPWPALTIAAVWALGLAGCGGDTCDQLHDQSFASVEQQVCDDTTMPVTMCSWTVGFHNGRYTWRRGAVEEVGDFDCNGDQLTGNTAAGDTRTGSYDDATTTLVWEGVGYTRQ